MFPAWYFDVAKSSDFLGFQANFEFEVTSFGPRYQVLNLIPEMEVELPLIKCIQMQSRKRGETRGKKRL